MNNDIENKSDKLDKEDMLKKSDTEFPLYTEKIVVKPSVKYKKLIMFAWIIAAGCIFGLTASLVISLCMPKMYDRLTVNQEERETLALEKDEYPLESDFTQSEDSQTETSTNAYANKLQENLQDPDDEGIDSLTSDEYVTFVKTLQKTIMGVQRSTVVIDIYKSNVEDFIKEKNSATETIGVVIGTVESEYIIMTNYLSVQDSDSVIIKFANSTEVTAQIIGKDSDAGIALLSIKESAIPSSERSQIGIAKMGNSYNVKQGDIIIAAGKINGQTDAIDYGTVTKMNTESGLDNSYQILDMGLACKEDDFSFVFNTQGNLIGVASYSEKKDCLSAIGLSDIKGTIEALSSGNGIIYMGIEGQNVTGALATLYGLPMGIYVKEVNLDSPAYDAGIQPGDVITGIDENMVLTIQAFSEKLYRCDNGQQVIVKVKRLGKEGYKEIEFPVTVSVR